MQPFIDRYDAGRRLAERLSRIRLAAPPLVLGLPRGGVPVAAEVARLLPAPLDVLVVRKLGVPGHAELAMGALAGVGSGVQTVRNDDVIDRAGVSPEQFDQVRQRELAELRRRQDALRSSRPAPAVQGQAVIVVDDGLATGATMTAAIAAVRQLGPAEVVAAVPVGARSACAALRRHADIVVCLQSPNGFVSVSQAYLDFGQTPDEEVIRLLAATRDPTASRRTTEETPPDR
jgi:putative phosphoribosyl transferase